MIDNLDSKKLDKRRQLIVHHEAIHGVDSVDLIDRQNFVLYFIEPQNQQKPHPDIMIEEVKIRIINGAAKLIVDVADICFEPQSYGLQVKLNDVININENFEVTVEINNAKVDPFFSIASIKLKGFIKNSNRKTAGSLQRIKTALPRLDYLAKDYDSFKKLIHNELAYNNPLWDEKNPSDMVVMLSEVLAYRGDYLSYFQDAVATESYLHTARQENSIKRHCRLLDYRVSSQLNYRYWVHFSVLEDQIIPSGTPLLCQGEHSSVTIDLNEYKSRQPGNEMVFETMHDLQAKGALNEMEFYSWGIKNHVVAKGAITFELKGKLPLDKGDVLVISSSQSSFSKQAVRLSAWPSYGVDSLTGMAYTKVKIYQADALLADCKKAIVYGNIVLADQGQSIFYEPLQLHKRSRSYYSRLVFNNIIYAQHYDNEQARNEPASECLVQNPYKTKPSINVFESNSVEEHQNTQDLLFEQSAEQWLPVSDFLNSSPFSKVITVETINNSGEVRFGNGEFGALPSEWRQYCASYRVTTDYRPKAAAETINQVCLTIKTNNITKVSNLTTAVGGKLEETRELTLKLAPEQHRQRLSLALPQDYIDKLKSFNEIKDAYCEEGWNGTRPILNLYIYPNMRISPQNLVDIESKLTLYKVINHRYHLKLFKALLLHIKVSVQTLKNVNENETLAKLKQHLGDGEVNNTSFGLLHKTHFTFNTSLYKSQVIQALMSVDGIDAVQLESFQRFDDYVGNDGKNYVCESVVVQGPEVISYGDGLRQSLVEISLNGGEHV